MEAAVGGDHENCTQLRQRIIEEEKRQAEIERITSRTSKIAALVNVSVRKSVNVRLKNDQKELHKEKHLFCNFPHRLYS